MDVKITLLLMLYLVSQCHGSGLWYCGGTTIDEQDECLCGNERISHNDWENYNVNCCGPDTCTKTESGATCPGGQKCTSEFSVRSCGDVRISSENTCFCGVEPLTNDDWLIGEKFCCPSSSTSQCSMTQYGDAECDGGIVKTGKDTVCDSGVQWERDRSLVRSGDICFTCNWYWFLLALLLNYAFQSLQF